MPFVSSSSANANLVEVPRMQTALAITDRLCSVAGPRAWNSLPATIRSRISSLHFRKLLKAFVFANGVELAPLDDFTN